MNPFPPAAAAIIDAAIDDYRLLVPPEEQTPAGLTDRIGQYLLSSGYAVRPDVTEPAR
ncbi:hypothetical protein [Streptomyces drozdowiczii]|uniref:Uncharacterized protein n=1 Tax=Streptomyces drozdowiczii TaxID=202862 RepID=A0ABY6PPE6_9ACTN|nr:hypothetical protein [Streptomyces drozdowiczii]MCX0246438.1 hypothetical protein [Streptomyces drozdowiczii]UZK54060.1 hypothetical protein NEH16_07765 [Streptomyces drozdowiczii]